MGAIFYNRIISLKVGILCVLCICACHKEDADNYAYLPQDFMVNVFQEQTYQMALAERLAKNLSSQKIEQMVNARRKFSADYILELNSLKLSSPPLQVSLSAQQAKALQVIDQKSGTRDEVGLLKALIDSDQVMIALHVKAASSSGVSDGMVRNWAEQKLPALRENLKETQNLK
ncbi:hypothetical protein [Pedobacter agri]|uniref:hypothetical protein n=1 Tax=Pedobacter agri TaxID=454586 RepID=UPI00292E3ED2|nr:hypothetical protein [Pedobacter agri]